MNSVCRNSPLFCKPTQQDFCKPLLWETLRGGISRGKAFSLRFRPPIKSMARNRRFVTLRSEISIPCLATNAIRKDLSRKSSDKLPPKRRSRTPPDLERLRVRRFQPPEVKGQKLDYGQKTSIELLLRRSLESIGSSRWPPMPLSPPSVISKLKSLQNFCRGTSSSSYQSSMQPSPARHTDYGTMLHNPP